MGLTTGWKYDSFTHSLTPVFRSVAWNWIKWKPKISSNMALITGVKIAIKRRGVGRGGASRMRGKDSPMPRWTPSVLRWQDHSLIQRRWRDCKADHLISPGSEAFTQQLETEGLDIICKRLMTLSWFHEHWLVRYRSPDKLKMRSVFSVTLGVHSLEYDQN